jgi:high affinity Mn2+ porin
LLDSRAAKPIRSAPAIPIRSCAFIRQTINLGGDTEKVEADINQFSGPVRANRLVVTLGKFGVPDVFDAISYAHDPRKDFMNWALIDAGTFDFAAVAWGYTYGAATEWYQDKWALRAGVFDLSIIPNSAELDHRFDQYALADYQLRQCRCV